MFIFTLTCLMKLNGGILCELIRCLRLCCCHAKRNAEKCRRQMQLLTSFTALRLFSVVCVVVIYCHLLLKLHTGCAALQLQARATNWTILIFSHSFCCLCHQFERKRKCCLSLFIGCWQLFPPAFLIRFCSFRKFTVREINTPREWAREAHKLRAVKQPADQIVCRN